MADSALKAAGLRAIVGPTWATDAPFRETAEAINDAKQRGILAVEMEAAAFYAFAKVRNANVLCIAHVTNTMGQVDQDFEKAKRMERPLR
jgi:purine-nucleoside phosphorylase